MCEPTLGAKPKAIADDEHPDHQLGIDRRPADVAVVGFELLVQVRERRRDEHVHPAQQVVLRDAIFEPKLIEQLALIPPPPTHHGPPLLTTISSKNGITVRRASQGLYRQHRPIPDLRLTVARSRLFY